MSFFFDRVDLSKRVSWPGRLYLDDQQWLIWNSDAERWEPPARARWYECGEVISPSGNKICTKLIGHGGEHGKRDV